ncbi:MAG: flagellar motor switch protein FliN [Oligoflexus sp.]
MAGDDMNPEDFGLGSDFDDALSQASGDDIDISNLGGKDDTQNVVMTPEDSRLAKTDFSKLKMILDVPLKVSVELGRTKMLVNDLLQLGQGSVIELDKIAGEPMEILINDKLVAMGEVVVVNEKFGVRLTDVVSQFGLGDVGNPT